MKKYYFKLNYDLVVIADDEDEARERLQNELDNMDFDEHQSFLESDQWEVDRVASTK
jgi:hypothetical protein